MTRVEYEFANVYCNNLHEMLDVIAGECLTACGNNGPEQIDDMVASGMTAEIAAAECVEGWGLDKADDEESSHMEFNEYTLADLAEAMQRFLDERPDRAACPS